MATKWLKSIGFILLIASTLVLCGFVGWVMLRLPVM